jgi:hypothetical protein
MPPPAAAASPTPSSSPPSTSAAGRAGAAAVSTGPCTAAGGGGGAGQPEGASSFMVLGGMDNYYQPMDSACEYHCGSSGLVPPHTSACQTGQQGEMPLAAGSLPPLSTVLYPAAGSLPVDEAEGTWCSVPRMRTRRRFPAAAVVSFCEVVAPLAPLSSDPSSQATETHAARQQASHPSHDI